MKFFIAILIISISITACGDARQKGSNNEFGKYCKIGTYEVYVPFDGEPNISPRQEGKGWKLISYQYAYPDSNDDLNYLYGIEIFDSEDTTLFQDSISKVEYLAKDRALMYEQIHGGQFMKQQKSTFRGTVAILQKMKVAIPKVGSAIVNSMYFFHQRIVLRMFVFTPVEKDENERIVSFYNSIKFDQE